MSEIETKIEDYIVAQPEWQLKNLRLFRAAMTEAGPDVVEDFKWNVPVFTVNGKLVSAMSTFKNHTKFNFFDGVALQDPHGLFNDGLSSKRHRSINLLDGDTLDATHLAALIADGVAYARA